MVEAALFPIPNAVAFPGTAFPLHVFEPRYRQMVADCIEHDRLLAICHTEQLLSPGKRGQSVQETLSSNQATYKPYPVFSAGSCEVSKTLADGRLLVTVQPHCRLKQLKLLQEAPYLIAECEIYCDHAATPEILAQAESLRNQILSRMLDLTTGEPEIQKRLRSEQWRQMPVVDFSFSLFGILQLDGDIQQQILQCRSPVERLNIVLQLLRR